MRKSKKNLRESFDSYYYRDDEDIHSSRQVKDLFKRELFHPTKDYSRQMKQAMAYTVEKNLHEKEKKNMKDTLNESEYDNPYGFTYKDTVITDKFGNYWTMDTWANNLSEPYATFDDAEASMLQCMEDCGLPTAEDVPDAEDYAYEFTRFAVTVVPNYVVGYETTAVASDDKNRVHSFAFDFIITGDDLASAEEARDRILNEINLVEGIQVVGNPNIDATSWSKEEYGLSESVELNESEEDKPEDVVAYYDENRCLCKNGAMEYYDADNKQWKLYASNRDEVKEFGDDDLLKWYDEKTKDSKELNEDAAGKYTVSWEMYERFSSGGVHTKSFSAKDDLDAILKIKKHRVGPIYGLNILVDDTTVYEGYDQEPKTLEDAVADSGCDNVEEYKEDFEPLTSVEDILEYVEGANGDGDDYIFYIKRPDGTYLFKADDADADDDWDDED